MTGRRESVDQVGEGERGGREKAWGDQVLTICFACIALSESYFFRQERRERKREKKERKKER